MKTGKADVAGVFRFAGGMWLLAKNRDSAAECRTERPPKRAVTPWLLRKAARGAG